MIRPESWREELGYTCEQMDSYLGLPLRPGGATWADLERGLVPPSVELVARCERMSDGRLPAVSWSALAASRPMSPRAWREELGFTPQEMGLHIGLLPHSAESCWRSYEKGLTVPTIDLLVKCQQLSGGRVTPESWLAVTMSLPKIPPGRLYGTRLQTRLADAARA